MSPPLLNDRRLGRRERHSRAAAACATARLTTRGLVRLFSPRALCGRESVAFSYAAAADRELSLGVMRPHTRLRNALMRSALCAGYILVSRNA